MLKIIISKRANPKNTVGTKLMAVSPKPEIFTSDYHAIFAPFN